MKCIFPFFLIITSLTSSAQQISLQGNVYEYIEKGANKTLSQVSITAPYSQGAKSGSDGKYNLVFDNEARTAIITVFKPGYELVNKDKDVYNQVTVDLSLVKQFHIYLDKEGNTEKRKNQLEAAYDLSARKKRDAYYIRIDKSAVEAKKVKKELEKQSGRSFRDIDDAKSYIAERYGANKKIIQDLIPFILQQNLDHSYKEIERIKGFIRAGKDDSILRIIKAIDIKRDSIKIARRISEIASQLMENKKEKEKYLLLIPSTINDGQYEKASGFYRLSIQLDTSDLDSYFNYALFLQDQNQFSESQIIYRKLIDKVERSSNEYFKAIIYNNLGILFKDSHQYSLAQRSYEKVLLIFRKLSLKNPDAYLPNVAGVLNNLGHLLRDIEQFRAAQQNLEEALGIRRKLAIKNPDAYLPDVSASLKNLGNLLSDIEQYDLAQKNYEEALAIIRKQAIKNPDSYEAEVASLLNNLGILLKTTNQSIPARKNFDEALVITRKLALKNPDVYVPDVAATLINQGNLFRDIFQYNEAQKSYEEALLIYRKLILKNPDVYLPNLGTCLNNLGSLLSDIKQYGAAHKNFEEALNIRRKLTLKNSDAFLPDLAASLSNLGSLYNAIKEYDQAKINYRAAMDIYRKLMLKNPDIYEPILFNTLGNLCEVFVNQKLFFDAIDGYEELLHYYNKDSTVDSKSYFMFINFKLGLIYEALNDSSGKSIFYYTKAKTTALLLSKNDTANYKNTISEIDPLLSSSYGNYAWYLLFQNKYDSAEISAKLGLAIDSVQSWIKTNLAHSLLLQGKYNDAFSIYESMKNTIYPNDKTKTFGDIFLTDLHELEEKNAIPPNRKKDVLKIEEMLRRE